MPPEIETYLRLVLVSPLALLAVLAYAIVRRYLGWPTPTWAIWAAALLFGFAFSPTFVLAVESAAWMLLLVLPLLWVVLSLVRGRRFRTAGMLLLGTALPGALLWGWFVLSDAMDPVPLYREDIVLWWLPTLAGTLTGGVLVGFGDRVAAEPRVMRGPLVTARDPMALGNRLTAAVALGPLPMPMVAGELVAFVATLMAVGVGSAIGLPWPVLLLGGATFFSVIATEAFYLAYPPDARRAWAAFSYVGSKEVARWRAVTGRPAPATEAAMHTWLRDNEERPETRPYHAELLAVVGRVDEARAMAERIEADSTAEGFEKAALLDYIDWIDGADVDFAARLRDAERVGEAGSSERLFARGLATIGLARDRAAGGGGDWMAPLHEFEEMTRPAGWRMFRSDTYQRLIVQNLLIGLFAAMLATLPAALLPLLL